MNRELKDIFQVFSIGLFPFAVGAIFAPLVRMQIDLSSSSSSWLDEIAMAWYISSITFGLLAMIIVALIGKLYERAGTRAYNQARAIYPEAGGWLDYGFFYYAYQVGDLPAVCTKYAPKEKKVRAFVI